MFLCAKCSVSPTPSERCLEWGVALVCSAVWKWYLEWVSLFCCQWYHYWCRRKAFRVIFITVDFTFQSLASGSTCQETLGYILFSLQLVCDNYSVLNSVRKVCFLYISKGYQEVQWDGRLWELGSIAAELMACKEHWICLPVKSVDCQKWPVVILYQMKRQLAHSPLSVCLSSLLSHQLKWPHTWRGSLEAKQLRVSARTLGKCSHVPTFLSCQLQVCFLEVSSS